MAGMALSYQSPETLLEFWRKPNPAEGRGFKGAQPMHCPECGRFAKISGIATRLGLKLSPGAPWYMGCAFKVYCKKDGESVWLL
ncbi:hypothetical protein SEA_BIG4_57 [Microbacterium phage Big4]|nr:hypothetical protein SEA_BIG4_57 [Microbacterium phage Big4]